MIGLARRGAIAAVSGFAGLQLLVVVPMLLAAVDVAQRRFRRDAQHRDVARGPLDQAVDLGDGAVDPVLRLEQDEVHVALPHVLQPRRGEDQERGIGRQVEPVAHALESLG